MRFEDQILILKLTILFVVFSIVFYGYYIYKYFIKKDFKINLPVDIYTKYRVFFEKNFEIFSYLKEDLKDRFIKYTYYYYVNKEIVGMNNHVPSEEEKLFIYGYISLLSLGFEHPERFIFLKKIYLYPSVYKEKKVKYKKLNEVRHIQVAGQSFVRKVKLTVDNINKGKFSNTGYNLVIHEFAHQLDHKNFLLDGNPILGFKKSIEWRKNLNDNYKLLIDKIKNNENILFRKYGAMNKIEFFAVGSELYFEKSVSLQNEFPAYYDLLKSFYKIDIANIIKTKNDFE